MIKVSLEEELLCLIILKSWRNLTSKFFKFVSESKQLSNFLNVFCLLIYSGIWYLSKTLVCNLLNTDDFEYCFLALNFSWLNSGYKTDFLFEEVLTETKSSSTNDFILDSS